MRISTDFNRENKSALLNKEATTVAQSELGDYMLNYENIFLQDTNPIKINLPDLENSSESETETVTPRPEVNSVRKRRDKELALNMYLKFQNKNKKNDKPSIVEQKIGVDVKRPKKIEKSKFKKKSSCFILSYQVINFYQS
jgi:hypothetical protein